MKDVERRLVKVVRKLVRRVLGIMAREKVLVIGNPVYPSRLVAEAFYQESLRMGSSATLLWQKARTMEKPMEQTVREAIVANPDVVIAASQKSLGHDSAGRLKPYRGSSGEAFNNILYFLRAQKKLRAFWFPLPCLERFVETASVDYDRMGRLSLAIKKRVDRAEKVRIRTKYGTDLVLVKDDRQARCNYDGDSSRPGSGGNLPMGEVFVTPVAGGAHQGDVVVDVSLFIKGRTYSVGKEPIYLRVEDGFVKEIKGGRVARILSAAVKEAEERPIKLHKEGRLSKIMAKTNSRNARNIGEVAVGVNPKAKIVGDLIEDEKVYGTAHIAIGAGQYDGDPAFIHVDCVINRPEVSLIYPSGKEEVILKGRKFQFSY